MSNSIPHLLVIQRTEGGEPAVRWALSKETLRHKFSLFLALAGTVHSAYILEPNPCGAKRTFDIALRWVKGEWR